MRSPFKQPSICPSTKPVVASSDARLTGAVKVVPGIEPDYRRFPRSKSASIVFNRLLS